METQQIIKEPTKSIQYRIFVPNVVKHGKSKELKDKLQLLILSKGMKETHFYKIVGLTKQLWYQISWGIWEPRDWLKIKIAQSLGVDSRVIWP